MRGDGVRAGRVSYSLLLRWRARSEAEELAEPFPDSVRGAIWAEWSRTTEAALAKWQGELPESVGAMVEQILADGRQRADEAAPGLTSAT